MAVWGEYMESMLRQQIQAACDAVHRDPDDGAACDRLQRLLTAATNNRAEVEQPLDWHRLIRRACDEVYDAPEDPEASTPTAVAPGRAQRRDLSVRDVTDRAKPAQHRAHHPAVPHTQIP